MLFLLTYEISTTRSNPFKHLRFAKEVNLLVVRWCCRYPLSYRDLRDPPAERALFVDTATVYRRAQKVGPAIRKRTYARRRTWRGLPSRLD